MNLIKLLHIWWWPLKQHLNIWNGRKYFSMLSICGNLKGKALSKGLIFELNIYIGEYMAMAVFYGEYLITNYSMWGSKFVAGQGRTWPNRTFPVSTSKYSSWSQAIQVNRKNCYTTLWDQTSILCFQRQIHLIEQIDLSSVLDKHVDKIFSWKKEMAQIMQTETGWPKVDKLDEKIKLSQTHWQILLATFSHFPPN